MNQVMLTNPENLYKILCELTLDLTLTKGKRISIKLLSTLLSSLLGLINTSLNGKDSHYLNFRTLISNKILIILNIKIISSIPIVKMTILNQKRKRVKESMGRENPKPPQI